MSKLNRWNYEPDVVPQGDEFLATSRVFPGIFAEGKTREEAIDSFWEMVEFIGGLAREPDWPHSREPCVEERETVDDAPSSSQHGAADDDGPEPPPWEEGDAWKAG